MPAITVCEPTALRIAPRIFGRSLVASAKPAVAQDSLNDVDWTQGTISFAPMSMVISAIRDRCALMNASAAASCDPCW
jgi:hypothetical protein